MGQENSIRKIELAEKDFLLLIDTKKSLETAVATLELTISTALDNMNEVLTKHTVRDPSWKGQVIPFEKKRLFLEEEK